VPTRSPGFAHPPKSTAKCALKRACCAHSKRIICTRGRACGCVFVEGALSAWARQRRLVGWGGHPTTRLVPKYFAGFERTKHRPAHGLGGDIGGTHVRAFGKVDVRPGVEGAHIGTGPLGFCGPMVRVSNGVSLETTPIPPPTRSRFKQANPIISGGMRASRVIPHSAPLWPNSLPMWLHSLIGGPTWLFLDPHFPNMANMNYSCPPTKPPSQIRPLLL